MTYSDFDLKTAVDRFALIEEREVNLFTTVEPIAPSDALQGYLDEYAPIARGVGTEMARSTFIITPLLVEAKRRSRPPMNILPGVALDVDRSRGLTGYCDHLISRSPGYFYVRAPIVAVVEAKREDIIGGLGQCVAEMVAIRLFNEHDSGPTPVVYGCVTSGNVWQFLKLEGPTITIDRAEYYLDDPAKLLGILVYVSAG